MLQRSHFFQSDTEVEDRPAKTDWSLTLLVYPGGKKQKQKKKDFKANPFCEPTPPPPRHSNAFLVVLLHRTCVNVYYI